MTSSPSPPQLQQLQSPAFLKFSGAIRSPYTKKIYCRCLKEFTDFLHANQMIQAKTTDALLPKDADLIESWIIAWINSQKEHGLSVSIMHVRKSALKLFYDVNKVQGIAWKIISKTMGENRKLRDRPYTREEIQKMLDKTDFRGRVVMLLLASTGMRIGAVPELKWGNLVRVDKYGSGIYQIVVYEGTSSEYVTFCTPECAKAVDNYIDFRRRHGEVVEPDSPLIREQFDRAEAIREFGKAPRARHVSVVTVVDLIRDALIASGLREVNHTEGTNTAQIRHPVKQSHGFRKFYDTTMTQAGVHPLYVELLLGHDIALKGSYFRPTTQDLLLGNDRMLGYSAAIDALTINEENRLRSENMAVKKRNELLEGERDEVQTLRMQLEPLLALKAELERQGVIKEAEADHSSCSSSSLSPSNPNPCS